MNNNKEKKNIFVFLEKTKKNNFILLFLSNFSNYNFYFFIWDENKKKFYSFDKKDDDPETILFKADVAVNLLSKNNEKYHILGQKLEKMKLTKWQNSLATNLLFFQKSNIKKIFNKFNYLTPVYRKINSENNAVELFNNFSQPSRIFSKKNIFFSGKLTTIKDIDEILKKENYNNGNYYIEKYVEGKEYYVFICKTTEDILTFSICDDNIINNNINIEEKINKKAKEAFINFGIEKFALIHFKVNNKNLIYFLNIFTDFQIFQQENKIIKQLFEKYNLNLKRLVSLTSDI